MNDVPAPESKEVTDAVKARGEDGQLLTGYVQVSKDELPAPNSAEIEQIVPVVEKKDPPIENNESHQNGGEIANYFTSRWLYVGL